MGARRMGAEAWTRRESWPARATARLSAWARGSARWASGRSQAAASGLPPSRACMLSPRRSSARRSACWWFASPACTWLRPRGASSGWWSMERQGAYAFIEPSAAQRGRDTCLAAGSVRWRRRRSMGARSRTPLHPPPAGSGARTKTTPSTSPPPASTTDSAVIDIQLCLDATL